MNHEETTPAHWTHSLLSPTVSGSTPPPPPPHSSARPRREPAHGTNGTNGTNGVRTLTPGAPTQRSPLSRSALATSTQRVAVVPAPVEPLAVDTGAFEPVPETESWPSFEAEEPGSADMAKLILPPPPPPRMFSNVRRGEALLPERSHDPTYYPGLVNDPEPEPEMPRKWPRWGNYAVLGGVLFIAGLIARGSFFGPSTWSAVIDVAPSDAHVSVDGQTLDGSGSPRTREGLIAGEHTLMVEQAGYVSKREVFTVSGSDRRVVVSLDREPKPEEKPVEAEPEPAAVAAPAPAPAPVGEPEAPEQSPAEAALAAATADGAHVSQHELAKLKRAARVAERYRTRKAAAADRSSRATNEKPIREPSSKRAAEKIEPVHAAKSGAMGLLKLNSVPWSDVTIDRKPVGHTPLLGFQLPAGKHVIELKNPDSGMRKKLRIQVHAGETVVKIEKLGK